MHSYFSVSIRINPQLDPSHTQSHLPLLTRAWIKSLSSSPGTTWPLWDEGHQIQNIFLDFNLNLLEILDESPPKFECFCVICSLGLHHCVEFLMWFKNVQWVMWLLMQQEEKLEEFKRDLYFLDDSIM